MKDNINYPAHTISNDDVEQAAVCLPCFSGRAHKNNTTHFSLMVSSVTSVALIVTSAMILAIGSLASSDKEDQKDAIEIGAIVGGGGISMSIFTAGLFYRWTKKKNEPSEIEPLLNSRAANI